MAAVILIILFIISYKFHLPFSDRVTTVIKIGTVAGLIYILATFRVMNKNVIGFRSQITEGEKKNEI
ncbi:MAG: hypothetical protein ACLR7D_07800 [Lachnospira eligens]